MLDTRYMNSTGVFLRDKSSIGIWVEGGQGARLAQGCQSVNHPCIINLEDVIDTPNFFFIVLELAEGGELFDKIIKKKKLNKTKAKLHFFQIALAFKFLHFKKMCHRDLKPENVLLCLSDKSLPIVKIKNIGLNNLGDKTRLSQR